MSGQRSKSVRERVAASFRGPPKPPVEISYGDIVLLGMQGVGKTAIVSRFVNNYFTENYVPSTSKDTYECCSLIECEKEDEGEKKMIFKKSFKKSIAGKSRPLKPKTTMKRVLTVNKSAENANSCAFEEGKQKGLKTLKFNLVDTPHEMVDMEPFTYKATISNAKGFLLVCSFDIEGSLEYIQHRFEDIKGVRNVGETPILLIANKSDIDEDERKWDESKINELAAQLRTTYCLSSVATKEGCEEMTTRMLNEINMFAEEELFLNSLPEDYVYYDKHDEADIGVF